MPPTTRQPLLSSRPELVAEWDYTKNAPLDPCKLTVGSKRTVWWKCSNDASHRWEARIGHRTRGTGCPSCSGRAASATSNMATTRPDLAAQWHPTLNGALTSQSVRSNSHKVVWWQCPEDAAHVWQATPQTRARRTHLVCPLCTSVRKAKSLTVSRPDLASEWHPTRNTMTAADVSSGQAIDVWWQCARDRGHEWCAQVRRRNVGTSNCPFCPRRPPHSCEPFARARPRLLSEWHPTLNGTLDPASVTRSSLRKVWWRCVVSTDHEWQVSVSSRVFGNTGCPFCTGRKVAESTSLLKTHPHLAVEWHPTLNELPATQVRSTSRVKRWWRCAAGHEWQQSTRARSRREGGRCPRCASSPGVSLSIACPDIAKEWDGVANGSRTAADVTTGSGFKATWRCGVDPGHVWRAAVNSRTKGGTGCPHCAGNIPGPDRMLPVAAPELLPEWHPTLNGDIDPATISAGVLLYVWWQCRKKNDHVWRATVANRVVGTGCPHCHPVPQSRAEIALAAELAAFVPIDPLDHRVDIGEGRPANCDIVLRDAKIIVEYDGAYWHAGADSYIRDVRKTERLAVHGWRVIRVRESPLAPIGESVNVEPGDVFAASRQVLGLLEQAGAVPAGTAAGYTTFVASSTARRWLAERRAGDTR
jgi:hypothetical protein